MIWKGPAFTIFIVLWVIVGVVGRMRAADRTNSDCWNRGDIVVDVSTLFADRIGGVNFGRVQQTFKFTLIDDAKRAFAQAHPNVKLIDMGVGEPEELPSEGIMSRLAVESRVKANRIYPCNGTMPFRESAARYLRRLLDLEFDPQTEIMHCIGAKAALAQIPFAFVNPGDTVLATEPGYPVLPKMCAWLGARVISLKLEARNAFLPDLAELKDVAATQRPKMLLLNYPNNPTGAVATRDFLAEVVELAHRFKFLIVQDAAYSDFVFDGRFHSPLQVPGGREVTLEVYSLSKSYNMQGYRLGFVAGGSLLVKAFSLVKDNTDNGQFVAIQLAGVEALDRGHDLLQSSRIRYQRRLERTASILTAAGLPCEASPSTFYLYVPVPKRAFGKEFADAQSLADFLIAQFGLITVPWDEAGPHLRFSMTFEVGTSEFTDEDAVFAALESRLIHGRR